MRTVTQGESGLQVGGLSLGLGVRYRIAQVLLTLGVFEFIGPIFRDTGSTHLLNPAWVGHARFHLAWALVFMGFSALVNVYLIWFRRPRDIGNLYLALLWQACNVFGFWGAVALERWYGGALVDPHFHMTILGLNENVFVFVVLAVLLLVNAVYLRGFVAPMMAEESER